MTTGPHSSDATRATPAGERHTILVVDDEPLVVDSVRDLLRLQYRVLGTTRAAEGMAILQREEVHVVMTDQRMPEMTGVEFLRRIRGQHPDAIRLLFTGYADVRAVIDAINQGSVFRYINKPWDPEDLETIVHQACEQYDLLVDRKRLVAELETKNAELERAFADLKRIDQLKSAFIQVASHELRTPVTVLLLLVQLASRRDAPASLKDLLDRITRTSERLAGLVEQMTTMLAAGSFERSLKARATDLSSLLEAAAEDVRPFVELRRQELALEVPADLGQVEIDAPKIRDTINHLLLNAIKFSTDGACITLAACRTAGGDVQVEVIDNGVGISSSELPRVFDPFFTGLDVSHHSSGVFEFGCKGLGLGLCLVKAFVEMHGGRVSVRSEPGHGSTFTVMLPGHQPPSV